MRQERLPYLLKGHVTSFIPSWYRLSIEQHGIVVPLLVEAKHLKSAKKHWLCVTFLCNSPLVLKERVCKMS